MGIMKSLLGFQEDKHCFAVLHHVQDACVCVVVQKNIALQVKKYG